MLYLYECIMNRIEIELEILKFYLNYSFWTKKYKKII